MLRQGEKKLTLREMKLIFVMICYTHYRSELEEYSEQQEQERRRRQEKEEKKRREHLAKKNHYLISTEVIPGVFNSPFLP